MVGGQWPDKDTTNGVSFLDRAAPLAVVCTTADMQKNYGWLPDPQGHVVTSFGLLRQKLGTATFPRSNSLRAFVSQAYGGPGIFDQSITKACTGHAVCGSVNTYFATIHQPIPIRNPVANYKLSQCIDRVANPDGTMPPLVDQGAMISSNMRAITEWGCPSIADWPGDFPADPVTINDEPPLRGTELASDLRLENYYRIDSINDQRCVDIMTGLSAGFPMVFGAVVDEAFEEYRSGALQAPDPGNLKGGHAMYLIGFEWDGVNLSSLQVEGVNSWNYDWGLGGCFMAARGFIDLMDNITVMRLSKVGT